MSLIRSKDRKVANQVNKAGSQASMANTFGLPSGKTFSCPGATSVCETICYAGKLEKVFKGVRNVLVSNYEQLLATDLLGMVDLLNEMITDFKNECEKRNAEKLFRIHWDGDFFSEEYARAWNFVIRLNPDVQFWAYTRSDFAVPILIDIENLALYFSADSANKTLAWELKRKYGVKLAYLAKDFATGKSDFNEQQEKSAIPCPENNKKIPMISEKGSACVTCSQCVFARNDILFSASKK
jgi:Gene product 88